MNEHERAEESITVLFLRQFLSIVRELGVELNAPRVCNAEVPSIYFILVDAAGGCVQATSSFHFNPASS